MTGNKASLWLNDGLPARMRKLREVSGLMRIDYKEMTSVQAQYADRFIPQQFDRMLDAQCTGEAASTCAEPNALRFWSLERVIEYGYLQRMLAAAFKLLKPGGVLVYLARSRLKRTNGRSTSS